jgi:muramoyltetrapeptide carboxypeptidase
MEKIKKVAIFSPASAPPYEDYVKGLQILKTYCLPFKTFVDFSDTPAGFKALLLYELLTNKEFSFIWAARGGFGCIKILPYLDELIETNPHFFPFPLLIGFSDITALHLYFYQKFKKPGLHAPMIINLPFTEKKVLEELIKIVYGEIKEIRIQGKPYQEGEAKGLLLGGNLITLASLCGTPFFPLKEMILFIEEVNEKLYRLERAFIQIVLTLGKERIKGLIVGNLGDVDPCIFLKKIEPYLPSNIPIAYGFPIGHISQNYPLIIGITSWFKVENKKAELYERI